MNLKDAEKKLAAEVYAATGNLSEAARAAGVNRSTLTRWSTDEEFLKAVSEYQDEAAVRDVPDKATKSLGELVDDSVAVIQKVLEGDKSLVPVARVALDTIKTAAQLAPKKPSENTPPPLADLLAKLDERDKRNKD